LLADVRPAQGPNVIHRENGRRRMVVGMNTNVRDLESLVLKLESELRAKTDLLQPAANTGNHPADRKDAASARPASEYHVSIEGEYVAQQEAARRIALLFAIVVGLIAILLYGYFRSASLVAQVLINVPLALMGAMAFTWWQINNISIATLVGFIAVAGVAARNSIMMLSHYLHLIRHEGESFTWAMIERGTLERLVPVLMTALSAGIALIPLVLSAGEPGKEILHPVAVAIVGGLVSCTLLDLVVTPAVFWLIGRKAAEKALRQEAPAAN
jgi:Cu/Ag efflux pump CusA